MCGIAGRFNYRSGRPVDEGLLGAMCELLSHRGPDGQGVQVDGPIGLGHRRLAVIDLTDAGQQPMVSSSGRLAISFNGEIYNFRELRAELEQLGHRFQSRTDTEVVLHAYAQWSEDCVPRLDGMFAFAIWDADARELFLARDRVGKKPLYYRVDQDGLAFASEPKAFLAEPSFEPQVNAEALSHFLTYQYVPAPLSAFRGIERLPPGHVLRVSERGTSSKRYWKLSYQPGKPLSESEAAELVLDEVTGAVGRRLVSDVPLGAFLSGGIDSATVVALMSLQSAGRVKTFSIGFDEERFSELEYARLVAERYSTEHHEFIVRPDAASIFDRLVWHYNEPFADASAIPTFYLSELTRRHVTVALNGDGGDESFAGYERYGPDPVASGLDRLPGALRRSMAAAGTVLPADTVGGGLGSRVRRTLERSVWSDDRRYAVRMMVIDPWLREQLLTPEFRLGAGISDPADLLLRQFAQSDATDHIDRMMDVDIAGYLPDALLVKVDIATMAHGLEGRSPFLDHRVMELAAGLPSTFKRRNGTSKYILRKAVGHLLPNEILERPKRGFSVPLGEWFRGPLRELTGDLLLDATARSRGIFVPAVVERLLHEHADGTHAWQDQLWNMLMLEMWHRTFIDRRPALPESADRMVRAGG